MLNLRFTLSIQEASNISAMKVDIPLS